MVKDPFARTERVLELLVQGPRSSGDLAEALGLTRQGAFERLRHMKRLGLVRQVGQGRSAKWERVVDRVLSWDLVAGLEEDRLWASVKEAVPELEDVSDETRRILGYGMTEMLNNAIEHSEGSRIQVIVTATAPDIVLEVIDDGIGALAKVRTHFGLSDDNEAILHISKGEQTTAPAEHSGQGLFFTSKLCDRFELRCEGRSWVVDNLRDDQTIAPGTGARGTQVRMTISPRSDRRVKDVFDRYSDVDEHGIQRSAIRVELAQGHGEFVSRSEARRLTSELDRYEDVTLDFANVDSVGQGFVDQVFRVWAAEHPGTRLTPINMNDEVAFMVRRGLRTRDAT